MYLACRITLLCISLRSAMLLLNEYWWLIDFLTLWHKWQTACTFRYVHKIQRNSENNFQSGDFCYLRSYCVGTHTCVRTCILPHMATMRLYTCVYACYKAVYRPTRVFTHVYSSLPLYTPVATCVYMPVSVYIHVYSRIEEDCSGADGWATKAYAVCIPVS